MYRIFGLCLGNRGGSNGFSLYDHDRTFSVWGAYLDDTGFLCSIEIQSRPRTGNLGREGARQLEALLKQVANLCASYRFEQM